MKNKTYWQRIYSLLFLSIVFSILIIQLLAPEITISSISENYLLRKLLINKYLQFKYEKGDKVFPSVVVGEEGWLYYTEDLSLRNYQKVDPLSVSEIKRLVSALSQIDEKVNKYGGTFVLVVPPDKSTIYPQYMPDNIPVIGTTTSLDRLVERVNKYSDIKLLDLRSVLIEASKTSRVYYQTDTHWNCNGAYYSYREILSELNVFYPELTLRSFEDFEITSQRVYLDLSKIMGVSIMEDKMDITPNFDVEISAVPNPDLIYDSESLRVVSNSNADLPNLMVFHDSFYTACLSAQLETAFGSTVSIPYNEIDMDEILKLIETEQPDVVVVEFVERFMDYFLRRFAE